MKTDVQEDLMVRYLLGDLPETEQAALEEKCFSDSDTFDRMWETENRLVDGYVRATLAPGERNRFEAYYLASPVHRRRVAAARHLIDAAGESFEVQSESVAHASFWQRLVGSLRPSSLSPAWQSAMAAAVVLLAAGGMWLLVERTELRRELAQLKAENAARQNREQDLARQIAAEQSERGRLSAELEQLRQQQSPPQLVAPLPVAPQPPEIPARPSRPSSVFSFVLLPVSLRGSAGNVLAVPPNADQVELQLALPQGDWNRYHAEIKTAEGALVWSHRQLKPRAGNVSANVPAGKLPFNDYILTLSGVNRAGGIEVINRYSFRVTRE